MIDWFLYLCFIVSVSNYCYRKMDGTISALKRNQPFVKRNSNFCVFQQNMNYFKCQQIEPYLSESCKLPPCKYLSKSLEQFLGWNKIYFTFEVFRKNMRVLQFIPPLFYHHNTTHYILSTVQRCREKRNLKLYLNFWKGLPGGLKSRCLF